MESSDGAAARRRDGARGQLEGRRRSGGVASGVWGTVALVPLLGLACCLPTTVGLSCLQRNSTNATAAGVPANCLASATFCYAVTYVSGGIASFGVPPNFTFSPQGCYESNLTAFNLTCPHAGTANLLKAVNGVNYTYTCCSTANCNSLANSTAANRPPPGTGDVQEQDREINFLDESTVPDVPARSLSSLEIALLAILGSFGFIGGIVVDLAALSKFPFSDN